MTDDVLKDTRQGTPRAAYDRAWNAVHAHPVVQECITAIIEWWERQGAMTAHNRATTP